MIPKNILGGLVVTNAACHLCESSDGGRWAKKYLWCKSSNVNLFFHFYLEGNHADKAASL